MEVNSQPSEDATLTGAPSLPPGTYVLEGRFRVERLLGAGAMGMVYVAEQVSLGRRVALKVLRDDVLASPGVVERFRREALLLSSVEHPSVVRVIDFGTHGHSMCLVMELAEGPSLQQLIEQQAPFAVDRVERIMTQLAQGLAAIHSKGIVHRDLKPDNVVMTVGVDGFEQARLLDFGVARVAEPDPRPGVTQQGFVVGTPEYMSPEQAMGLPLDSRSDLYALGLIAFRMLTGQAPFPGPSPLELASQQVHQPVPSVLERSPDLASFPRIVQVVTMCMQKSPDDRPANAHVLLELLFQPTFLPSASAPVPAGPSPSASLPDPVPAPIQLSSTLTSALRTPAPVSLLARAPVAWWKLAAVGGVVVVAVIAALIVSLQPERRARRLVTARRGSEALQVIDDAGPELSTALTQLKAAALFQVNRGDDARKVLDALAPKSGASELELEDSVLEALADEFGQTEGRADGVRTRKLLASWPKSKVLPVMQRLATQEEGWAQWGALRFVDLEYAGQGLNLAELYIRTLEAKDCGRRVQAAKRLGELRNPEAVEALTKLKSAPKKECGQEAAAAALRRIERDQGP